jgi:hypothetical protein
MESIPETIVKVLDAVAKYAWAVLAVCVSVVFLPDGTLNIMGLSIIREDYLGFWWIGMIFSAVIAVSSVGRQIVRWISRRKRLADQRAEVLKRVNSLNQWERMWIAYCLLHNTQTMTAQMTDPTANSLETKGFVTQGSGSILNLPYHLNDFVWEYARRHRQAFLPDEVANDHRSVQAIEDFATRVKRPF